MSAEVTNCLRDISFALAIESSLSLEDGMSSTSVRRIVFALLCAELKTSKLPSGWAINSRSFAASGPSGFAMNSAATLCAAPPSSEKCSCQRSSSPGDFLMISRTDGPIATGIPLGRAHPFGGLAAASNNCHCRRSVALRATETVANTNVTAAKSVHSFVDRSISRRAVKKPSRSPRSLLREFPRRGTPARAAEAPHQAAHDDCRGDSRREDYSRANCIAIGFGIPARIPPKTTRQKRSPARASQRATLGNERNPVAAGPRVGSHSIFSQRFISARRRTAHSELASSPGATPKTGCAADILSEFRYCAMRPPPLYPYCPVDYSAR